MTEQTIAERRAEEEKARQLQRSIDFMGLRAQATAVGMLQLCHELLVAGVIDDDAIGRIKNVIATDIIVARKPSRARDDFEASLRRRLDMTFPHSSKQHPPALGPLGHMPPILGDPDDFDDPEQYGGA